MYRFELRAQLQSVKGFEWERHQYKLHKRLDFENGLLQQPWG